MKIITRLFIVIAVEDPGGRDWLGVVEEMTATVWIDGLRYPSGQVVLFKGEAYHLRDFCLRQGLTYKQENVIISIEI